LIISLIEPWLRLSFDQSDANFYGIPNSGYCDLWISTAISIYDIHLINHKSLKRFDPRILRILPQPQLKISINQQYTQLVNLNHPICFRFYYSNEMYRGKYSDTYLNRILNCKMKNGGKFPKTPNYVNQNLNHVFHLSLRIFSQNHLRLNQKMDFYNFLLV